MAEGDIQGMGLTRQIPYGVPAASSHRFLRTGALVLIVSLIAAIDHLTGSLPVHHLYYLPIILAAIWFRSKGGLTIACSSVLLYHLANPNLLQWKNLERDLMQLVMFIGVGVVTARLSADAAHMKYLAMTDDLTGLHNLRSFEVHYEKLLHQAISRSTEFSLILVDLDHLKDLNTRFGHLAGARSIQVLGHMIAEQFPDAIACRYGGDEFVIALPDCSLTQAVRRAENLRATLAQFAPTLLGQSHPRGTLTLSAGAAAVARAQEGNFLSAGEALFHAADEALYRAKELGRNRVFPGPAFTSSAAAAPAAEISENDLVLLRPEGERNGSRTQ